MMTSPLGELPASLFSMVTSTSSGRAPASRSRSREAPSIGVGPNDAVIATSQRLGAELRQAFLTDVPEMPESTYNGGQSIMQRDDLAGLNLTSVPKVLIECANMRNATDAQMLVTASFQQQVARAIEAAIIRFLRAG